ncbi:MAG: hypothetical protein H6707_14685 [Deltaproteobacteria bacterium]|nr:hypothetical protein [Deltaproteobacteria bacterium]
MGPRFKIGLFCSTAGIAVGLLALWVLPLFGIEEKALAAAVGWAVAQIGVLRALYIEDKDAAQRLAERAEDQAATRRKEEQEEVASRNADLQTMFDRWMQARGEFIEVEQAEVEKGTPFCAFLNARSRLTPYMGPDSRAGMAYSTYLRRLEELLSKLSAASDDPALIVMATRLRAEVGATIAGPEAALFVVTWTLRDPVAATVRYFVLSLDVFGNDRPRALEHMLPPKWGEVLDLYFSPRATPEDVGALWKTN